MILFLVVFSLALTGGLGAPTAAYKFVICNPEGNQANCIPYQSTNEEWSPDLPSKLPASQTLYMDFKQVDDERDPEQETGEEGLEGDDMEVDEDYGEEEYLSPEEGESPVVALPEDGSGYEGSAFMMGDWASPADNGSGELLAENYKPNKGGRKNRKGAIWSLLGERKPAEEEMKEDLLLQP